MALLENGYVRAVDQGLAELTGYGVHELLGLHWRQLCEEATEQPPSLASGDTLEQAPVLWRRKDGVAVPFLVRLVPLRVSTHESDTAILSVVDVAGHVHQRPGSDGPVRTCTGPPWIVAERHRTVGGLMASLAHEFNNPLCGVRSVIERMIRKTNPAEPDRGLLELALEQCERMRRLLQELQSFLPPATDLWGEFDLHAALDAVLLLLNKHLQLCGVSVRTEYSPPLMVRGVNNQLKHLLLLLIKARGAAWGPVPGELLIRTGRDAGRVWCALIGGDNRGATNEALFMRLSDSVERDRSVLAALLKAHGGEIRVDAAPGQGASVTLFLPVGT
jgi:hypothetical protein